MTQAHQSPVSPLRHCQLILTPAGLQYSADPLRSCSVTQTICLSYDESKVLNYLAMQSLLSSKNLLHIYF